MSEIAIPLSDVCLWGHLGVNFISFCYNVAVSIEIQDKQKKKNLLSSALWIHSIISSVLLVGLLIMYNFVVLNTDWTLSKLLMVFHILFNIIIMVINATNPDLSKPVLWTYQVTSSIVMIIIVSFFTNTWEEIWKIGEEISEILGKTKDKGLANAKKETETKTKTEGTKTAPVTKTENPVTKTETKKTKTKNPVTKTETKKTDATGDFGKRQRRRNKKY